MMEISNEVTIQGYLGLSKKLEFVVLSAAKHPIKVMKGPFAALRVTLAVLRVILDFWDSPCNLAASGVRVRILV